WCSGREGKSTARTRPKRGVGKAASRLTPCRSRLRTTYEQGDIVAKKRQQRIMGEKPTRQCKRRLTSLLAIRSPEWATTRRRVSCPQFCPSDGLPSPSIDRRSGLQA